MKKNIVLEVMINKNKRTKHITKNGMVTTGISGKLSAQKEYQLRGQSRKYKMLHLSY
jgi:hypothetical protein